MFQPMLYGLGKWEPTLTQKLFYCFIFVHCVDPSMLISVNIKPWGFISLDQSMLDDIEKTINDDMKRIVSWLQQLK